MNGTIPVDYKGQVYNIPFEILYPADYPTTAPQCRIVPTDSIIINPSEDVDPKGCIFTNILKDWNRQKDSLEVIQHCIECFSNKIPVLDIGSFYINEMWKVSNQIDDLMIEKRKLEQINNDIKESIKNFSMMNKEKALESITKEVNELEDCIKTNSNKKFDFDNDIVYKSVYHKAAVESFVEEDTFEDISKKLIEAFHLKAIPPAEFITTLKQVYNDKFMALKKKEKILG